MSSSSRMAELHRFDGYVAQPEERQSQHSQGE
jgi:hypothetical protein